MLAADPCPPRQLASDLPFPASPEGATAPLVFPANAHIRTSWGDVAVGDLRVGMAVATYDHGPLPIRKIHRHSIYATESLPMVEISAGQFGAHRDLCLSASHRLMFSGWRAQVLFGEDEVLAQAGDLVSPRTKTTTLPSADTVGLELVLDGPQLLWANGVLCETGIAVSGLHDQGRKLSSHCSTVSSLPFRPSLQAFEAQLLAHSLH